MKKRKGWKVTAVILAILAVFLLVINGFPLEKSVERNPFLVEEGSRPLIAAHRGGAINNPENTMLAFREAILTAEVDILESDLHLTKDGYLVFNHDNYIDRTCNVNGDVPLEEVEKLCEDTKNRHYIHNMTLAELQQYNFGYYFVDQSGNRPYQNVEDPAALGLQIATVEQLFAEFYESHPDLLFIVEIKGSESRGINGCKALWKTLKQYPAYMDRIVVGTFHDEVEEFLRVNYPVLLRGASTGSAVAFVAAQLFRVDYFYDAEFACLQIPPIPLGVTGKHLVTQAHKRNIAVQFWTINEEAQMRSLIEQGCDCIMTDDPILLKQVMKEYGLLP